MAAEGRERSPNGAQMASTEVGSPLLTGERSTTAGGKRKKKQLQRRNTQYIKLYWRRYTRPIDHTNTDDLCVRVCVCVCVLVWVGIHRMSERRNVRKEEMGRSMLAILCQSSSTVEQ